MKKIILLTLLTAGFLSCKTSQKTASQTNYIQKDSIIKETIIERLPAVVDTFYIDNPCDSSGILTQFYGRFSAGQGKVSVESFKGKIRAIAGFKKSETKQVFLYRDRYITKTVVKTKEVTKKDISPYIVVGVFVLLFLYIRLSHISL